MSYIHLCVCAQARFVDEVKERDDTDPDSKITENQEVLNMHAQMKALCTDAIVIFAQNMGKWFSSSIESYAPRLLDVGLERYNVNARRTVCVLGFQGVNTLQGGITPNAVRSCST